MCSAHIHTPPIARNVVDHHIHVVQLDPGSDVSWLSALSQCLLASVSALHVMGTTKTDHAFSATDLQGMPQDERLNRRVRRWASLSSPDAAPAFAAAMRFFCADCRGWATEQASALGRVAYQAGHEGVLTQAAHGRVSTCWQLLVRRVWSVASHVLPNGAEHDTWVSHEARIVTCGLQRRLLAGLRRQVQAEGTVAGVHSPVHEHVLLHHLAVTSSLDLRLSIGNQLDRTQQAAPKAPNATDWSDN